MVDFLDLEDKVEALSKALIYLSPESGGLRLESHSQLILDLIKDLSGDEANDISYWLYDLNRGKDWKKGCITDKDGRDIKLKTLDDLYDSIISSQDESQA